MISQELITWFQEEVKKEIIDEIEIDDTHKLAISLHDEDGIVWVEGFKHARVEPQSDEDKYLIHYSLNRELDFGGDFPYSVRITVID